MPWERWTPMAFIILERAVTYNDHIDPVSGEWVTVTVDLSTVWVVGEFIGAQMSGFDVAPVLGLIDHIADGELGVPYADRTVVVAGGAALLPRSHPVHFLTERHWTRSRGYSLENRQGPVSSRSLLRPRIPVALLYPKTYTVTIPAGVPVTSTITTSASPVAGGTTTGDGTFDNGTSVTVIATHSPDYAFVNWTENGVEVSASAVYRLPSAQTALWWPTLFRLTRSPPALRRMPAAAPAAAARSTAVTASPWSRRRTPGTASSTGRKVASR